MNSIPLCKKCAQDDSRRVILTGFQIFCAKCGLNAYSWYDREDIDTPLPFSMV